MSVKEVVWLEVLRSLNLDGYPNRTVEKVKGKLRSDHWKFFEDNVAAPFLTEPLFDRELEFAKARPVPVDSIEVWGFNFATFSL